MTSASYQPQSDEPSKNTQVEPPSSLSAPPAGPAPPKARGDSHQAALRMLEGAAKYGVTSKDTVAKIVHLACSSDHILRRATIPALTQVAGPDGYRTLVRLLDDPNVTIQGEAAEALGNTGAAEAIEPLKTLLSHKEPVVALRAAIALGRLKDQSGLPVVIRFVRRENPHAGLAAFALGVIVRHKFRPNPEGIAAARRYLKQMKKK